MKSDFLPGTDYTLHQPEGMYHFTSDASLLGEFMHIKHSDTVLDIGCHTGVLMLYAAKQEPGEIHGIDLFKEVLDVTKQNMESNHIEAVLHEGRIQDFRHDPYDVLICNPPYFTNENSELVKTNPYLAAARHDRNLPTEELFQSVKRLMKEKGHFYLVQRPQYLNRILQAAYANRMCLARQQYVYDKTTNRCRAILLEFVFGRQREVITEYPLTI